MDENAVSTNSEETEENTGGDVPSAGEDPTPEPTPTPEPADPMLAALKIDLGIRSNLYDERLQARITAAQQRIGDLGITLAGTEEDNDLVLMYAAWLWRCRTTGEGMPRMLESTLHNRLFGQKARIT